MPTSCTNIVNNVVNPYRKGIRGNWRTKKAYTYLTDRIQTNYTASSDQKINIREDGLFLTFSPYWIYNSGQWSSQATPAWQWSAEVTKWLPTAQEIENMDPLGGTAPFSLGTMMRLQLPQLVIVDTPRWVLMALKIIHLEVIPDVVHLILVLMTLPPK
ncbi:MAG: hypothetical protein IPL25_19230 [Saprospiraceae bacterium]|nr:hypothetical protein [Candidatus Vicinibacter affinis]